MSKILPTYLPVWELKFEKIKKIIKTEIDKPKKERKKLYLRKMLKECKELRVLIKAIKKEHNKKCVLCGGIL